MMESSIKERIVLEYERNPCFFSAFIIDMSIVLIGFWLSFVAFVQYTWWSYLLSFVILVVMLGLAKSLLLKNVILYQDKLVLRWYFFKDKIIFIDKIKELRTLTATWACWKFTLLEKQPFDYKSIWVIVNESILGTDEYKNLETEIKKLIKGK